MRNEMLKNAILPISLSLDIDESIGLYLGYQIANIFRLVKFVNI